LIYSLASLRRTDSQTGGEVKATADLSLAVTTLIFSAKYGDDSTVKAKCKVNLSLAALTPSFFLTRTEALDFDTFFHKNLQPSDNQQFTK
jgi:hypothetical protein